MNRKQLVAILLTPKGRTAVDHFVDAVLTNRPQTRHGMRYSTTSCRGWQLAYGILSHLPYSPSLLLDYVSGRPEYYEMVEHAKRALAVFYSNPRHPLYKMIVGGEARICSLPNEEKEEICMVPTPASFADSVTPGNYYFCMYKGENIDHFFLLIVTDPHSWYISSSYGTDWVCIPEYTHPIRPSVFRSFLQAMESPSDHTDEIRNFYETYFLRIGSSLPLYYSEEYVEGNKSLKGKKVQEGERKELEELFADGGRSLRVGHISGMDDFLGSVVSSGGGGRGPRGMGRRRRTKRGSRKVGRVGSVRSMGRVGIMRGTTKRNRGRR
jgi:hypothetical protein